MTKKNGFAFPSVIPNQNQDFDREPGMTNREYFAAMALQGLMASVRWEEENGGGLFDYRAPSARVLAAIAVNQADELIKALNGQ